jgi:hypothetical protein
MLFIFTKVENHLFILCCIFKCCARYKYVVIEVFMMFYIMSSLVRLNYWFLHNFKFYKCESY